MDNISGFNLCVDLMYYWLCMLTKKVAAIFKIGFSKEAPKGV